MLGELFVRRVKSNEFIVSMASGIGVSSELIEKGIGAFLWIIYRHVKNDLFNNIVSAIPNGSALGLRYDFKKSSGFRRLISFKTASAVFFGMKKHLYNHLITQLTQIGFTPTSCQQFLSYLYRHLQQEMGEERLGLLESVIPELKTLLQEKAVDERLTVEPLPQLNSN